MRELKKNTKPKNLQVPSCKSLRLASEPGDASPVWLMRGPGEMSPQGTWQVSAPREYSANSSLHHPSSFLLVQNLWHYVVSLYFYFILFFNFTILYWFCHISTWIRHRYTCVPHPEPSSLLLPCTIPLGRPSAPAPSIQYHASNLDWWLVSYMVLFMFQCHSPKSSHPLPLPQSPKDHNRQHRNAKDHKRLLSATIWQ